MYMLLQQALAGCMLAFKRASNSSQVQYLLYIR